jgi:hypothetical protein
LYKRDRATIEMQRIVRGWLAGRTIQEMREARRLMLEAMIGVEEYTIMRRRLEVHLSP